MTFFYYLAVCIFLALITYNIISYLHATGTIAERLCSCWKGSMTIFALIWTTILSLVMTGTDFLSSITGDPQFAAVGNAVKSATGANLAPWISIATLALPLVLGTLARMRTLPK
jgi:hypothetical protein